MNYQLLRFMGIWPPLLFAGVRVKASRDLKRFDIELVQRWWNKNFVGTAFGGTLYAMTDPFYMLMLLANLGRDFIVWDKSACIEFKKPGRGRLKASYVLTDAELQEVKEAALRDGKVEREYIAQIFDTEGDVVAEAKEDRLCSRKTSKLKYGEDRSQFVPVAGTLFLGGSFLGISST